MTDQPKKRRRSPEERDGATPRNEGQSNLRGGGNDVLEAAIEYTKRGWATIPIQPGSKKPEGNAWQNQRLTLDDLRAAFPTGNENLGVLLGAPSNGLIDSDLDCKQAMFLAPRFLPPSAAVFGHASKEESHWLYVSEGATTWQLKDTDGTMLVELRSTGGQMVFPPSVHPSGESSEWNAQGDPPQHDPMDLRIRVGRLGAAVIIARHWPARGARNDAMLALAGGLFRAGLDTDDVEHVCRAVLDAAKDEEADDRIKSIQGTKDKLEAGDVAVTGWPTFAEIVGKDVVAKVLKWLRTSDATRGANIELTEIGNARLYVARHSADLRYTQTLGWLGWDSKRWARNAEAIVHRAAEETVESMWEEAKRAPYDQKAKLFSWAKSSSSRAKRESMIQDARWHPELFVDDVKGFDAQPLLLNCQNGTLDLETGELRPPRSATCEGDLCTRVGPQGTCNRQGARAGQGADTSRPR